MSRSEVKQGETILFCKWLANEFHVIACTFLHNDSYRCQRATPQSVADELAHDTVTQIASLSPSSPPTLSNDTASPTDIPERADSRRESGHRATFVRRYREARTFVFSSTFPSRLLPAIRV
jgi:hypothetical protein